MKHLFFSLSVGTIGCLIALQIPAAAKSTETVVYSFCTRTYCQDGAAPMAGLIETNGMLFGTTEAGGAHCTYFEPPGCGAAFSLDPATGAERTYSFEPRYGAWTESDLIDVKGTLYGTTSGRGAYGAGTVFKLDPGTGAETVLHAFGKSADGADPYANVIDVKGTLYGTTCWAGPMGAAARFLLDKCEDRRGDVLTTFGGGGADDGSGLFNGLLEVKGILYGVTTGGGANCTEYQQGDCGTIFSVTRKPARRRCSIPFAPGRIARTAPSPAPT